MLEAAGLATVSISITRTFTERVKPPRALYLRWPFGHAFGEPGNADQQMTILKQALRLVVTATEPGTLIDLPYLWRRQAYQGVPETITLP